MRKFTCKNKYGFSLIETLIAVSILMIAIAGPLSLVQAGLFSSIHQRNQVTATYLAQEAIEFVKNLRDNNSYYQYDKDPLVPRDWLAGPNNGPSLLTTCGSGNGCYVDPHQKLPGSTSVYAYDTPRPLWMNVYNKDANNNGIFAYDYNTSGGGTQTSFIRTVKITAVSTDEVTLSVTVGWMDNALPRSYTVSTNLYNYEIADAEAVTPPPPPSGSEVIGQMHFRYSEEYGGCPIATAPITNAPGHQIIPPSVTADYGSNCYLEEITINDSGPGYVIKPFPFRDYDPNHPEDRGSFLEWPNDSSSPVTYPGATGKFWGVPVEYLIVTTPSGGGSESADCDETSGNICLYYGPSCPVPVPDSIQTNASPFSNYWMPAPPGGFSSNCYMNKIKVFAPITGYYIAPSPGDATHITTEGTYNRGFYGSDVLYGIWTSFNQ